MFGSDEEQEAASKFNKNPIPIDHNEARELEKKYPNHDEHAVISLVVTYEEKTRFEKEECYRHKSHSHEDYPSLYPIGTTEMPINGLENIAEYLGLTHDYLKSNWKKMKCPINKGKQKAYAYPSQLKIWRSSKK